MENNKYRLVGVLNLLDADTDFVIPVFENEGVYFTQAKTNPLKIDAFDFLLNPEMMKRIEPIHQYNNILMPVKKSEYIEDDNVLYGLQFEKNELFLGSFDDLKKYIYGKEMQVYDYNYILDSINEINCLRRG